MPGGLTASRAGAAGELVLGPLDAVYASFASVIPVPASRQPLLHAFSVTVVQVAPAVVPLPQYEKVSEPLQVPLAA